MTCVYPHVCLASDVLIANDMKAAHDVCVASDMNVVSDVCVVSDMNDMCVASWKE